MSRAALWSLRLPASLSVPPEVQAVSLRTHEHFPHHSTLLSFCQASVRSLVLCLVTTKIWSDTVIGSTLG